MADVGEVCVGCRCIPLLIIGLFVFVSIFGEWLTPLPFNEQNLRLRFLPPAWLEGGNICYLLGTDNLGRDMLSRIIVGAQASFIVAHRRARVRLGHGLPDRPHRRAISAAASMPS